jgi:hypothetical protein
MTSTTHQPSHLIVSQDAAERDTASWALSVRTARMPLGRRLLRVLHYTTLHYRTATATAPCRCALLGLPPPFFVRRHHRHIRRGHAPFTSSSPRLHTGPSQNLATTSCCCIALATVRRGGARPAGGWPWIRAQCCLQGCPSSDQQTLLGLVAACITDRRAMHILAPRRLSMGRHRTVTRLSAPTMSGNPMPHTAYHIHTFPPTSPHDEAYRRLSGQMRFGSPGLGVCTRCSFAVRTKGRQAGNKCNCVEMLERSGVKTCTVNPVALNKF